MWWGVRISEGLNCLHLHETLVSYHITTRLHNPEDHTLNFNTVHKTPPREVQLVSSHPIVLRFIVILSFHLYLCPINNFNTHRSKCSCMVHWRLNNSLLLFLPFSEKTYFGTELGKRIESYFDVLWQFWLYFKIRFIPLRKYASCLSPRWLWKQSQFILGTNQTLNKLWGRIIVLMNVLAGWCNLTLSCKWLNHRKETLQTKTRL